MHGFKSDNLNLIVSLGCKHYNWASCIYMKYFDLVYSVFVHYISAVGHLPEGPGLCD